MDAYPTQYRKMDFSLGELLEKFEKHFGILATRILLGIFSLAAVSYCLHIIYHYFCIPIYLIDSKMLAEDYGLWNYEFCESTTGLQATKRRGLVIRGLADEGGCSHPSQVNRPVRGGVR